MYVYIHDLEDTGELFLYYPNSNEEITERFINKFLDKRLVKLTEEERIRRKTLAEYEADETTFDYWYHATTELQPFFNDFANINAIKRITFDNIPVFQ